MKTLNEMELSFESRSSNEGFARSAVSAFIAQLDPTISELNDIRTAVSEAVTNCVVHAYKNTIGKINVQVKIAGNSEVIIKIRDRGCGIEDIKKAMEPLFTTAPSDDRAGLGFAVMQSFTDSMNVRSSVGKGTTVTLKKRLSQRIHNG
ncbi:MAG: anti-sigma F factor [Clostridia bacterium]|nr:anti-sigma F factor [Clostridia bacterium]